jgi:23S rRNA pseudouridine2605 synthase
MMERLQKILAGAGIASRRAAEQLILDSRVSVNNRVVTRLGTKADPEKDEIRVNGNLITTEVVKLYIMLNKPGGYVTTLKDPEGRPIVTDLLQELNARVYPVGRLDYDSEGLLLLTNDGDFSQKLQHPRFAVPKTYLVKIKGRLPKKDLQNLAGGVELDDGRFVPKDCSVERINVKSTWVRLTIHEGRNRIIKRAFEALGHTVARLVRVSVGSIDLGKLRLGEYRHLKPREIEGLLKLAR